MRQRQHERIMSRVRYEQDEFYARTFRAPKSLPAETPARAIIAILDSIEGYTLYFDELIQQNYWEDIPAVLTHAAKVLTRNGYDRKKVKRALNDYLSLHARVTADPQHYEGILGIGCLPPKVAYKRYARDPNAPRAPWRPSCGFYA